MKTPPLTLADLILLLVIGTREAGRYFVFPETRRRWKEALEYLVHEERPDEG